MAALLRLLFGALVCVLLPATTCCAAEAIRIAAQKTGTLAWELAVIRAHGLDKSADLVIETTELASPEAGKIALRAGTADLMVSDWLWVSRERALGARLVFYPYSSAAGALMVPANSAIRTLGDLRGKKLAVAGGPLDKNWLLLQAALKRESIDLKSQATISYGAPPLLAAKLADGEMDAGLNYWNFCAALEAKGFRRLAAIEDLLPQFGAKGPVAMIGYVFDEDWANAHRDLLGRFLAVTAKAKEILATSDAEWDTIAALTGAANEAILHAYRARYRDGIPHRPVSDEEADARLLYRVLASIGGPELVGPAVELSPGTYYNPAPGD